mmetsp:Transcript_74568/g.242117  ORF Transcript_74568/g.242117 Transcript_74568/m.242117 type:complete len:422 (+) Transcript_74568:846-2111(+)
MSRSMKGSESSEPSSCATASSQASCVAVDAREGDSERAVVPPVERNGPCTGAPSSCGAAAAPAPEAPVTGHLKVERMAAVMAAPKSKGPDGAASGATQADGVAAVIAAPKVMEAPESPAAAEPAEAAAEPTGACARDSTATEGNAAVKASPKSRVPAIGGASSATQAEGVAAVIAAPKPESSSSSAAAEADAAENGSDSSACGDCGIWWARGSTPTEAREGEAAFKAAPNSRGRAGGASLATHADGVAAVIAAPKPEASAADAASGDCGDCGSGSWRARGSMPTDAREAKEAAGAVRAAPNSRGAALPASSATLGAAEGRNLGGHARKEAVEGVAPPTAVPKPRSSPVFTPLGTQSLARAAVPAAASAGAGRGWGGLDGTHLEGMAPVRGWPKSESTSSGSVSSSSTSSPKSPLGLGTMHC